MFVDETPLWNANTDLKLWADCVILHITKILQKVNKVWNFAVHDKDQKLLDMSKINVIPFTH